MFLGPHLVCGRINARVQTSTGRSTPHKTESFAFLCDVFCGTGHEDMNGTLIVF
jgi:heme/copper-type cytochrome/quinol oxidase subunit 2